MQTMEVRASARIRTWFISLFCLMCVCARYFCVYISFNRNELNEWMNERFNKRYLFGIIFDNFFFFFFSSPHFKYRFCDDMMWFQLASKTNFQQFVAFFAHNSQLTKSWKKKKKNIKEDVKIFIMEWVSLVFGSLNKML